MPGISKEKPVLAQKIAMFRPEVPPPYKTGDTSWLPSFLIGRSKQEKGGIGWISYISSIGLD